LVAFWSVFEGFVKGFLILASRGRILENLGAFDVSLEAVLSLAEEARRTA